MNTIRTRGFTIIEVVLVLAIAGLIFLMVFIALPTLQTNQRDTQRRDDLSRFKAQLNQFQANNKGAIPSVGCTGTANSNDAKDFQNRYVGTFNDPASGSVYGCVTATPAATGEWRYQTGQKCNGESTAANAGTRNYAVQMKLEGSGMACLDNV